MDIEKVTAMYQDGSIGATEVGWLITEVYRLQNEIDRIETELENEFLQNRADEERAMLYDE
jgi:hypothetical protein